MDRSAEVRALAAARGGWKHSNITPQEITEALRAYRRGVRLEDVAKVFGMTRAGLLNAIGMWAVTHAPMQEEPR